MQGFIKTIINAIQAWTKGKINESIKNSVADWNENDSSKDSYIKNRPFYGESESVMLVDNLTYADYNNGQHPKCNFIPGQSYEIIWNGKSYKTVCYFDGEYNIIADESLGCPFYIDDDGGNDFYVDSDSSDWTVSVLGTQEYIKKIDSKYLDLPDNIATTDDVSKISLEISDALERVQLSEVGVPNLPVESLSQIAYGNGKFVAVCDASISSDIGAYSYDGIKWVPVTLPKTGYWHYLCFVNNKFIAAVADLQNLTRGSIATSDNGIEWEITTLQDISYIPKCIDYGAGKYVLVGRHYISNQAEDYYYSEDCITWEKGMLPASHNWEHIVYNGDRFVIASRAYNHYITAYSTDGITWVLGEAKYSIQFCASMTFGDGKYVIVGNSDGKSSYSYDGIRWSLAHTVHSKNLSTPKLIYSGDKFILTYANSSVVFYSEDGITWTEVSVPHPTTGHALSYGNGKYIALSSGVSMYSYDGIVWSSIHNNLIQNHNNITSQIKDLVFEDIPVKPIRGDGLCIPYKEQHVSGVYNQLDPLWEIEEVIRPEYAFGNDNTYSVEYSDSYVFNEKTGEIILNNPVRTTLDLVPVGYYYRNPNDIATVVRIESRSGHLYVDCRLTRVKKKHSKYANVVGNGTSYTNRSNAHTLDWDGNAWYQGDVYVGGSGQDDGKKLATEEYVDDALANINITTSWNDLTDKPFGEELGLVEILPETTLDFEFTSLGGSQMGPPDGEYEAYTTMQPLVEGQEYTVIWDGVEHRATAYIVTYPAGGTSCCLGNKALTYFGSDSENTDEPFAVVYDPDYESSVFATSESTHTISILTQGIVVKQIDEKFIPNNIARISAAAVGQTIAVKAVDEDGKPTEWEAVKMADPEWKVIKTLTLTEDAETVVIDKDDNGNSFSLRECIMYIEAKATASAPIEYIPNGYWTAGNYTPSAQKTATDYPYKFAIHCYGKTGEYFWGHEIMSKSQPSGNSYRMHTENGTVKKAPITSFKLTGKFATGAVFVLYGKESNE